MPMTGRRRPHLPPPTPPGPGASTSALAVGALLLSGCGVAPWSLGGLQGARHRDDLGPGGHRARPNMPGMPAMAQAYARWINDHGRHRRPRAARCSPATSTTTAVGAAEVRPARRRRGRRRGRRLVQPARAARSWPRWRPPGSRTSAATASPTTSSPAPLSYPVNGGQPALLAGNGKQLAAGLRAGLPGAARHHRRRPAARAPRRGPARRQRHAPARRPAGRRGRHRVRDAHRGWPWSGRRPGARADGCVTAVLGDRTDTFFDSFRRLDREDHPDVRISSVLGSVDQPVIDRDRRHGRPVRGRRTSPAGTRWPATPAGTRCARSSRSTPSATTGSTRRTRACRRPGSRTPSLKAVVESLDDGEIVRGRHRPARPRRRPAVSTPAASPRRCAGASRTCSRATGLPAHRQRAGDVPGGPRGPAGRRAARASWTSRRRCWTTRRTADRRPLPAGPRRIRRSRRSGPAASELGGGALGQAVLLRDGVPQPGRLALLLGGVAARRVGLRRSAPVERALPPLQPFLLVLGLVRPRRVVVVGRRGRLPRLGEGVGQLGVLGELVDGQRWRAG